jgi:hypothetical protein|tara:strand:- start:9773 stop:9970 length:198 start_codon:yes stop_codon:yes gene_type:complete
MTLKKTYYSQDENREFVADQQHLNALEKEIKMLKSRIQSCGSGNIYTAINVLEWRIDQILEEIYE